MAKRTYNDKGEKWCSVCKKYQPLHEFGKNNASNDGKDWRCIGSRVKKLKIKEAKIHTTEGIQFIDAPILSSQVLYKYQRPDAYDIYIQSLPIRTINTQSL